MALAVQRFDRGTAGKPSTWKIHAGVRPLPTGQIPPPQLRQYRRRFVGRDREAGTYEFFRRLVFSVLIGNGDMHLKNWVASLSDRRTPMLSPAYDFVATLPYIPNDSLALTFGGSRSLSGITADQVRRFADTPPACAPLVANRPQKSLIVRYRMEKSSRERPPAGTPECTVGNQILAAAESIA